MEVVCPECGTRFSLEEGRIPGSTARVRCSRCRHVFRITREGQVVVPDQSPAGEKLQVTPQKEDVQQKVPVPASPEPAKVLPLPKEKVVPEEKGPAPATTEAEIPVPPEKRRHWLWLPALLLAIAVLVGLGWRAWLGDLPGPFKPLVDVVQLLKGKWRQPKQPTPAPGPESSPPAPAPTVVTPPPPPVPAPDLKDLPVDWAQARYQGLVNDKGGGQLLMIQGEVINKGKTSRGPIRLRATLTDSQHQPLREEVVYAGTTFTDTEMKNLKPEEIKGWLAKPGGRFQEQVLKPGEKQPFTVLFFGVPDNLAETQSGFQIVVVEGPAVAE